MQEIKHVQRTVLGSVLNYICNTVIISGTISLVSGRLVEFAEYVLVVISIKGGK